MTENKKKWWLRGGLMSLIFPLSIIIYGFSVEGFGPFVFMLYALLAAPFSFAFGASLGNFTQGLSSPDTPYRFYKMWTIISGTIAFLPLLFLILGKPENTSLVTLIVNYYTNSFLFPLHVYLAIFIVSFYKIQTFDDSSDLES